MVQPRKSYMLWSQLHSVGYSRLHIFRRSWTAKQIRLRIYELLRPLIHNIPKIDKYHKNGKHRTRQEIIEREYAALFLDRRGEYDIDNPLYDIEIHNNLPHDPSAFFSKIPTCDICGQDHKDNCTFAFPDNAKLETILSVMKYERELELTINWRQGAKANLKPVESPAFTKINLNAPSQAQNESPYDKSWMTNPNSMTLYDCLSSFSQEETLSGSDKWYCSKCKEHVHALKKMEIYKTPDFLVIHFKRFSH
jgi:hypothetical protein